MKKQENWKPIADHEGAYEVSDQGRVRSLFRTTIRSDGMRITIQPRVLKPGPSSNGYMTVNLMRNLKSRNWCVHVLVARAFSENPHNYPLVDHEDRNKLNNLASNLRWADYPSNAVNRNDAELVGVHFIPLGSQRPWKAQLGRKSLGQFASREEARNARISAVRNRLMKISR